MKTINKCITAVLFRLTGSLGKSKDHNSLSDKLKTDRLSQTYIDDPIKNHTLQKSGKKLKRNPKCFVRFARMAGYSLFILLSANSYLTTTVHAASIVETFEELKEEYHQEFKSDIYEVWVKPIWYKSPEAWELDGIPERTVPFNPFAKGFEKSFTYKSINDIVSDENNIDAKCFQYFYNHPDPKLVLDETIEKEHRDKIFDPDPKSGYPLTATTQFRSESMLDDPANNFSDKCKTNHYDNAYDFMTHSNNWTTFDVGDDHGSQLGAVRIYIQLNTGDSTTIKDIKYDIRPNHTVTEEPLDELGKNNKFIKVRALGEEYVWNGSKLKLKKVLVLDVLQPKGKKWSGQFYVGFKNAEIVRNVLNPIDSSNFMGDNLDKHPLFIFANPLPEWYYKLGNTYAYNGCPPPDSNLGLPNSFYTPEGWDPGMVVETETILDADGILESVSDSTTQRTVNDLILTKESKRLCIPGGVYVKGRIIHNNRFHTNHGLKLKKGDANLSPGDTGNYNPTYQRFNNAKGVKIVGRGILSGINMKYRTKTKYGKPELDECSECPCKKYPSGGGWIGLIDIQHQGEAYVYTDDEGKVIDYTANTVKEDDNVLDCYYRDEAKLTQDVNCIQGITMVDSPKASIYTAGSRLDIENIKIMSWHFETNGIGSAKGSKIKNVFIKANDDTIVMGKSDMNVDNATVWRQRWGSVVNLSWKLKDTISNSRLEGLNVIKFDRGTNPGNGNAAIVSSRNLMGGTIENFTFKDIVVEEAPYEIINLQLDEKYTYKRDKRKILNQLDGTGNINNIIFDGVFTPAPYLRDEESNELLQKSVFSIYDEQHYDEQHYNDEGKLCFIDGCGNPECYDPADYTFSGRSISGIQLKNICIDDGDSIKGITASNSLIGWDVNTKDYFNWGVHINDYFKFSAGVNKKHHTTPPPYEGYDTGFNGIRGLHGSLNSADICAELKTAANMCTIDNLRELCPSQ